MKMTQRTIERDGIALYTETIGHPTHSPILLIMGAMSSGVWWPDQLCRQLADRGRLVIRYDHRDTGGSTNYGVGEASYSVEDLADDAIRVLDGHGLDHAHLVGMSLGGFLAQLIALKYPARILTLTLIASEPLEAADPDVTPIDQSILDYHARSADLDWTDRDAVIEHQVGAWRLLSGPGRAFDSAAVAAMAGADFDRTSDPQATYNHMALTEPDHWVGRLHEIDAPSLIIHGSDDIAIPHLRGQALQAALRSARFLTLDGAGHELHHSDWPAIVDAITEHTQP